MNSLVASRSNAGRWDIFCRVIDNYGDAGVCWRLAADLADRGEHIRLFIDQPHILAQLRDSSRVSPVDICPWPATDTDFTAADVADVVLEAFACDPPAAYVEAMSQRALKPVWINLEYLSAEDWIETHHRLPSPHPRYALTKHFFFPGFTPGTGGILREPARTAQLVQHQPQQARAIDPGPDSACPATLRIFLFSYEQPLLPAWLTMLATNTSSSPFILNVAPGPAQLSLRQWLARQSGFEPLPIRELPFVAQRDFDHLLDAHDLLFVRGEDSFVRAQLAGKPLVWHIYPQTEATHQAKLHAFYDRYLDQGVLTPAEQQVYRQMIDLWNNPQAGAAASNLAKCWPAFVRQFPAMLANARQWQQHLLQQHDLVSQLREFVAHLVK